MSVSEMDSEQVESEARKQGWKPESEWKGEPPSRGFVSAEEFLDAGDKSLPLVTKRLTSEKDDLQSELGEVKAELSKVKQQAARFTDFTNKALHKARQERENAIIALQKERAQAITDADGDKVIETERKIADLNAEPVEGSGPPPEVASWLGENPWYEDDDTMRDLANGISLRLKDEQPHLQGVAHLKELEKRVKKAMPSKFENPRRQQGDIVEGGRRQPPGNGKTFNDLPADAKQAYADYKELMAGMGKEYTKAQYLSGYEWDE